MAVVSTDVGPGLGRRARALASIKGGRDLVEVVTEVGRESCRAFQGSRPAGPRPDHRQRPGQRDADRHRRAEGPSPNRDAGKKGPSAATVLLTERPAWGAARSNFTTARPGWLPPSVGLAGVGLDAHQALRGPARRREDAHISRPDTDPIGAWIVGWGFASLRAREPASNPEQAYRNWRKRWPGGLTTLRPICC
jgi:hypothetical protein